MTFLITIAMTSPTYASEKFFFGEDSGGWTVLGTIPDKESGYNPMCQIGTTFPAGGNSTFIINKDLVDNELFIEVDVESWELGPDTSRVHFIFQNNNFSGKNVLSATYKRWSKGALQIRGIAEHIFLDPFMSYDSMMVLTEDNNWINLSLEGTKAAFVVLLPKCIEAFKRAKKPSVDG